MVKKTTEAGRFSWRLPSYIAIVGFIVFFSIAMCQRDTFIFLSVFFVAPFLLVISIVLLIYAAIGNGRRHLLSILATLAIVWAIPTSLFLYESEHPVALRETARWLVWSREYKHEVLAQPTSARGDLKHIEWDGWGYVPAGNTTVYLVFDPTDSVLTATRNQPGKFNGIPCEVYQVRRMENHWYALLFYTDQTWDQSSCASAPQE